MDFADGLQAVAATRTTPTIHQQAALGRRQQLPLVSLPRVGLERATPRMFQYWLFEFAPNTCVSSRAVQNHTAGYAWRSPDRSLFAIAPYPTLALEQELCPKGIVFTKTE